MDFQSSNSISPIKYSCGILFRALFALLFFVTGSQNKFSLLAQESVINIEKYTVGNGLSHNSVSGITQDKDGFLWISTYAGIDRFDGYSFKNYSAKLTPGIDLYGYHDIKSDRLGNIWACAFSSFVLKYNVSLDRFDIYTVRNKIPGRALLKFFFDSRNNLWLATASGVLYLKNGDDPNNIRHLDFGNTLLDSIIVRTIGEDKSGKIWLGSDQGLFSLTMSGDSVIEVSGYRFTGKDFRLNNANMVYTIAIDENDHLWSGMTKSGIREVDLKNVLPGNENILIPFKEFRRNDNQAGTISCDTIFCIETGSKGKLFIRSCKGIDLFDINTKNSIKLCSEGATKYNDIEEGNVTSALFYSSEGVLWAGALEGLFKITLGKNPFQTINNFKPDPAGLNPFKTSQVLVDSRNRLWIGTQGNGLHLGLPLDNGRYKFRQFINETPDSDPAVLNKIITNRIYYLSETDDGKIWVSALYFQEGRGKEDRIEFSDPFHDKTKLSLYKSSGDANQIININGNLWILYQQKGIKIYDTTSWSSKELYLGDSIKRIFYPYVAEAEDGRIFLRSETGLFQISRELDSKSNSYFPLKTDTLFDFRERYIAFPRGKFIITKADTGLWFWFPSISKGVSRYFLSRPGKKLEYYPEFNTENGLSNNSIYDIIENKNGDIWISTQNGLNRLDPQSGLIRSFYTSDGLPDNRFNFGVDNDNNGFLYFCNVNGVVKIHPDSLKPSSRPHKTFITRILLNGKNIREYENIDVQPPIRITKSLDLKHNQNYLSFEYAAIDYIDNKQIRYRYKMEGLNTYWIDAGNRRFAEYQDIRPGKYIFRVNSTESDGSWSENEALIKIAIDHPFWSRIWFYSLIVVFGAIAILYFVKVREKTLRTRNIWLEGEVKKQTDLAVRHRIEVDQMKSRFYANISHEFRTPLSLITSSAREIEKDPEIKTKLKFTGTILSASSRLLKLVNELMDLSKIEAGKLELRASEGNITEVVKLIWQTYLSDAERRGIKYSIISNPKEINGWFDPEFIKKIMHNLISNALKFTERGGEINIELKHFCHENGERNSVPGIPLPYVEIIVRDTGMGISAGNLSKIFDRFYQADSSSTRRNEGTGIGLSIVSELLKRHYGKIQVDSIPGEGSTFTAFIPIGKEHLKDGDFQTGSVPADNNEEIFSEEHYEPGKRINFSVIDPGKPHVLLVEDNEDLRNFLQDQLSKEFRISLAANGKEANEKSNDLDPDIIVSDVMMPVMDGVELCSAIKNNIVTSHIPVILLTAKADIESKLEGLRTGADDYLTKPFNEEELIVRIQNLLMQRQILRKKFMSEPLSEIAGLHINRNDESFLAQLIRVVESCLPDSSLSIEKLADKMSMGKRTLQRKIKALSGFTVIDFIKVVRIKHAAAIIASGKFTITEAAYNTGFNNLSYFTKVFREVMGVSPSEYIAR